MARYEVHRTDANAEDIYKAATKIGFSVVKLNRPVDSLWGIYDQTVAVEIKTATGKLEEGQAKFFATFKGMKRTVREVGDVVALYAEMRARHDIIFGTGRSNGQEESCEKEGWRLTEKGAREVAKAKPAKSGASRHGASAQRETRSAV